MGGAAPAALRLAVCGKGGAGKSVVAGTLARVLARRGERVLALDSDMLPGLTLSLGTEAPDQPPLMAAAERGEDKRWRLKKGIGPVRAVQRFSIPAPDGVQVLQAGKAPPEGTSAIMPALQAFYRVIHRLGRTPAFSEWTLIGDLPAGPRQLAYDWAPYADTVLLVVEPTWQSMLTARRVARIASDRPGVSVVAVANKVKVAADRGRIEEFFGVRVAASVPADPAVAAAERLGVAVIDHAPDAPMVAEIERLAETLVASAGAE